MENFGYEFDEDTADWWIRKYATYRWSSIHADSKMFRFADALDLTVYVCLQTNKINKPSLHLFSKIVINNLSSVFDVDDLRFVLFLSHCGWKMLSFLYDHQNLPCKYLTDICIRYTDTNQYYECITFDELVSLFPYEVISDSNELESICDSVLKDNQKSVEDYRKGKVNSINHLKGQVMKLTKGKADVKLVAEILERKLKI